MGNGKGRGAAWWLVLCAMALALSASWDSDGDPTTNDSPPAVLVAEVETPTPAEDLSDPIVDAAEPCRSPVARARAWLAGLIAPSPDGLVLAALRPRGP